MMFFNANKFSNLGKIGENLAEKYLRKKGYRIVERNFKNSFGRRIGEIDIIAREENCLVFVEVKTRSFSKSLPEEHIDSRKIRKLSKIMNFYISKKNLWDQDYRLDSISIIVEKTSGKYRLDHKKSIFL